jgi:hypothetical protein
VQHLALNIVHFGAIVNIPKTKKRLEKVRKSFQHLALLNHLAVYCHHRSKEGGIHGEAIYHQTQRPTHRSTGET